MTHYFSVLFQDRVAILLNLLMAFLYTYFCVGLIFLIYGLQEWEIEGFSRISSGVKWGAGFLRNHQLSSLFFFVSYSYYKSVWWLEICKSSLGVLRLGTEVFAEFYENIWINFFRYVWWIFFLQHWIWTLLESVISYIGKQERRHFKYG